MSVSKLTLREALAADRLEDFVRQEEAHGVELAIGSDFERGLALFLVQRGFSEEQDEGMVSQPTVAAGHGTAPGGCRQIPSRTEP